MDVSPILEDFIDLNTIIVENLSNNERFSLAANLSSAARRKIRKLLLWIGLIFEKTSFAILRPVSRFY